MGPILAMIEALDEPSLLIPSDIMKEGNTVAKTAMAKAYQYTSA